ncbi:MAG: hypothetical protein J7518_23370 [Nocardioidaceae bacterium]|nr:hypothetical protein [Nocardioidaceae bacterium]
MTDPHVGDLVPEVALGVASGDVRAAVLAHAALCPDCRRDLEETVAVLDELLLLAPAHEPPIGFEARVLAALPLPVPLVRRTTTWLAAAAVVLAAVGGIAATRWAGADDRTLAAQYRHTLDVAGGQAFRAAALRTGTGAERGRVFTYEGDPSWIFMTVTGAAYGDYRVLLVTEDGREHVVGECWVRNGNASWGTAVDQPLDHVRRVEMRGPGGAVLTATFSS